MTPNKEPVVLLPASKPMATILVFPDVDRSFEEEKATFEVLSTLSEQYKIVVAPGRCIQNEHEEGHHLSTFQKAIDFAHGLIRSEERAGTPTGSIVLAGHGQGAAIAMAAGLLYKNGLGGIFMINGFIAMHNYLKKAPKQNKMLPVMRLRGFDKPSIHAASLHVALTEKVIGDPTFKGAVQDLVAFLQARVGTGRNKPKHSKTASSVDNRRQPNSVSPTSSVVPIEPLAQAQVDFALGLLRHTGAPGSTIISPVSISIALAMSYYGATNSAASQIRDVIAKGVTEEEVHAHFAAVLDLISSNNLHVTLETANKLFVHQNFELREASNIGIKKYKGQLEEVDFTKAAESAETINTYVQKATHDHIKDLIPVDAINDLTCLILVNAIYFKGNWEKEFNAKRTIESDFYATPEKTTKKELMLTQDKFPYYESDEYQVLGLPYKNEKVFLYIILPRERYGLDDLVNNLNGATLAQLLSKRDTEKVDVKLPKFKIEGEFELSETLQKLGIIDAFNDPDFSPHHKDGDLFLSGVFHKAVYEVAEKGAKKAKANTSIPFFGCVSKSSPPKEFIADHGFLYVLINADIFHVLFAGKVAE